MVRPNISRGCHENFAPGFRKRAGAGNCAVRRIDVGATAAKADDIGIVVYNAQHESLGVAWAEAFTKETGIPVTLRKGSDMEFANQIVQEGAASPADVFLTENSPAMSLVDGAGLFAPVAADTLAQVPENFRPSNGHWIGIAARSTVFAYDKTKLTRRQAAEIDARSCRSELEGPLGRVARPAPTSRRSSARCCRSRARRRRRPGSTA